MEALLEDEATSICGRRHGRDAERAVYRWGTAVSPVGFHGGKVGVRRPRLRGKDGGEVPLASFADLQQGDLLQDWAYELMLLGVATRRYRRAVRLEAGDVPRQVGDGTSKSAVSRRFVAMSQAKLTDWMARDLSELDLVVIQIDGMMVADHTLIVALGIDSAGEKHPLAVMEGATENAAVTRALIADLKDRGLADDRALSLGDRWFQGSQEGDQGSFRQARPHPTLPDPQSARDLGTTAVSSARRDQQSPAPGVQGRERGDRQEAAREPRAPARPGS